MSESSIPRDFRRFRIPPKRSIETDRGAYEITFDVTKQLGEGYMDRAFSLADGSKVLNGSQFVLFPHHSTSPYRITGETLVREVPQSGDGYFLGVTSEGEVFESHFDKGKQYFPIEYGRGEIASWIAGPSGLFVLSVATPVLRDDMKKFIGITDPRVPLPEEFRRRYKELTQKGR